MSLSMSVIRVRELDQLDGHGGCFAAADSQRGNTALFVVVLQCMHQSHDEA